jgi:hypothetical protein
VIPLSNVYSAIDSIKVWLLNRNSTLTIKTIQMAFDLGSFIDFGLMAVWAPRICCVAHISYF